MPTVHTTGFAELDTALGEFKPATAKAVLRRAGIKALTPMMLEAARLAPDDPKTPPLDLKTSFAISEKQKSGRQFNFTLSDHSITLYMGPTRAGYPEAVPQEFGTIHHAAHPYMRPAWDAGQDRLLDDVGTELRIEIDKATQRAARRAAAAAARAAALSGGL